MGSSLQWLLWMAFEKNPSSVVKGRTRGDLVVEWSFFLQSCLLRPFCKCMQGRFPLHLGIRCHDTSCWMLGHLFFKRTSTLTWGCWWKAEYICCSVVLPFHQSPPQYLFGEIVPRSVFSLDMPSGLFWTTSWKSTSIQVNAKKISNTRC